MGWRRKELSAEEEKEGLVEKMYGTDQLIEMVGECDYVVMATPFTPATHKMFSRVRRGVGTGGTCASRDRSVQLDV